MSEDLDALWARVWPAPAKLNLFLHVVGRRDDGYHLLQSAFRLVDLADSLRFVRRHDDRIAMAVALEELPSWHGIGAAAPRGQKLPRSQGTHAGPKRPSCGA